MALDLSGVSEDPYTTTLPKYVILSSEVIAIPGTNDILFYISDVGQLILANFLIEQTSGTHYLKKSNCPNSVVEKLSDSPTNLCVDKSHLDNSNNGTSLDYQQQQQQQNPIQLKSSDLSYYGINSTDTGYNSESNLCIPHGTSYSKSLDCFSKEVEPDQPVDATLPRQQLEPQSPIEVDMDKINETKQTTAILSRWVRHLLEDPKHTKDSNSTNQDVIVHGHNLSDISRFVKRLRQFRIQMGLSQNQLGTQLSKHFNYKTVFSQTLLSRFEKLNVTLRAACRLRPYLENWMSHVKNKGCTTKSTCLSSQVHAVGRARLTALTRLGQSNESVPDTAVVNSTNQPTPTNINNSNTDSIGNDTQTTCTENLTLKPDSPSIDCKLPNPPQRRPRRKRTFFNSKALAILVSEYAHNPRPSSSDFSRLATETGHDRESVRVWFCNRRVHDPGMNQQKS